jgi:hypothetical protein
VLFLDQHEIGTAVLEPQLESMVLEEVASAEFTEFERVGVSTVPQDATTFGEPVGGARQMVGVMALCARRESEESRQG